VARSLATALSNREDVEAVELRTDLGVMGPRFGRFMTDGFERHLDEPGWSYELAYRIFFGRCMPRRAAHLALATLGGRGLRRTITEFGADVIVTEHPVLSAALGQLRALGRLETPVYSSISDPAGLYYWAHPGIDLHLLSWPESKAEVDRIAGPGRAIAVRPLIGQRFFAAPEPLAARETLSLAPDVPVVLVSGGGWGLGDLLGATEVALEITPHATVICLAGRNGRTQASLEARWETDPRVRVLGFSEQMPELLAASDVLVHTTGGTTALEARVVGCPLINYGRGVAHVRAHARALAELGIAQWAVDRKALGPAIERSVHAGRPGPLDTGDLPDAAEVVVQVPRRTNQRAAALSAVAAGTGA
jgi:UDP-N-acetylglucosamine:LPS N-acetylglucosamine transferase